MLCVSEVLMLAGVRYLFLFLGSASALLVLPVHGGVALLQPAFQASQLMQSALHRPASRAAPCPLQPGPHQQLTTC